MNILKAEGEVRRSGRARRSTRKGDRKRKRGEEDEDELEELEERKPTRQSKRSKSKAKKQASSDEEGDVSFIFFVYGFGHWVDFGLGSAYLNHRSQDWTREASWTVLVLSRGTSNLTIRVNGLKQSRDSIWSSIEITETTRKWYN